MFGIFSKRENNISNNSGMRNYPVLGYHRMCTILVFLVTVNPAFTGFSWSQPSHTGKTFKENLPKAPPQFDENSALDISVMLGQTAYLPCTVYNLGDKLVSWIRSKDLHILTSGKHTFTADQRFDVIFDPEKDTWSLRIRKSRISDIGKYECQVNTDPKMNRFFSLNVRENALQDSPGVIAGSNTELSVVRASILGPKEQYVKVGSTVSFECRLYYGDQRIWDKHNPRFTTRSVPNVQWMKEGLALSFQAERGGISVETERGEKTGSSRLTVASVGLGDSGRYTCTGQGITPDTVTLHVIEGEHTEAMQRDESVVASTASTHLIYHVSSLRITNICIHNLMTMIFLSLVSKFWIYNVR